MTNLEYRLDTFNHIDTVRHYLRKCTAELHKRGDTYDACKLESPEVELYIEHTPALAETEYGSEEYKAHLAAMKPALEHHYAEPRHHPEHFEHGINDMNLIDLLEMLCDWSAATRRSKNGNIYQSIKINAERFGISEQLAQILTNTVQDLLTDYSYTDGKGISVTSEERKDALTKNDVNPGDLVKVNGGKIYLVTAADDTGVTYMDLTDIISRGLSVRSVANINELHALTADDVKIGDAVVVRSGGNNTYLVTAVDGADVQFTIL